MRTEREFWKFKSPDWWKWKIGKELFGFYYNAIVGNDGLYVMEEDWDNLLIVDAARYDLTAETLADDPDVDVEKRASRGSATGEFVEQNFEGEAFHDTVYVTANPTINPELGDVFHEIDYVWDDGWDDERGTVLPAVAAERALRMERRHPDKRLIVHFIQPHYPFLGADLPGSITELRAGARGEGRGEDVNPWLLVRDGEIDAETMWSAYTENHRIALAEALDLAGALRGKSVVTSDHGNVMGDPVFPSLGVLAIYGHPWGVHIDGLIDVPWIEVADGERKRHVSEPPVKTGRTVESTVSDRLESLGYVD